MVPFDDLDGIEFVTVLSQSSKFNSNKKFDGQQNEKGERREEEEGRAGLEDGGDGWVIFSIIFD